jgi:hypothetical protein
MNDFGNLNLNNGYEIDLNDKEAVAHAIVRVTRSRRVCQLSFTTAVSQAENVIKAATGPLVQQNQYMIDRLEGSLDNLDQQYAQLNATNQQLFLLDATPGHQIDWEEAIYDTNSVYTDIQNRIDMAMLAVTVPVANTVKHPSKAKSPIAPTPSIHQFELYHTLFPKTKPVDWTSHKYYGLSESVISKMIHWAQLAKSRISMSHQSSLTCFDGSIENFSLAKFENLAPQQDVVSKLVNSVVVLESQIGINEECWASGAKSTRSSRSSKRTWQIHFRDTKSGSIRMKFVDFGVDFFLGISKGQWSFSFIYEKNLPQYGKTKFSTKKIHC